MVTTAMLKHSVARFPSLRPGAIGSSRATAGDRTWRRRAHPPACHGRTERCAPSDAWTAVRSAARDVGQSRPVQPDVPVACAWLRRRRPGLTKTLPAARSPRARRTGTEALYGSETGRTLAGRGARQPGCCARTDTLRRRSSPRCPRSPSGHRCDQPRPGVPRHRRPGRGPPGRRGRHPRGRNQYPPGRGVPELRRPRSPTHQSGSTASTSTRTPRCWSPPARPRRSPPRCSRCARRATRW